MADPGLLRHTHVTITDDAWMVKEKELDALRAENERLRRRLRSTRSFLDDSQRSEWTDKERAVALAACYRQLDMAL
jgi:uncharacterized protein YlxW (UPF0749 family)